jgi:hypothetical protein
VAAQPSSATTNEPTAYTARIVATGVASAAGAVLTSVIDSRGTLVGAIVVAMAVAAMGQAMRVPLDRLERRIKALGVRRGILIVAVLGFTVGAGTVAAHEVLGDGELSARIARKLQRSASQEGVSATPADSVVDDKDAKTPEKPASSAPAQAGRPPTEKPAAPTAPDVDKQSATQPTPVPSRTPAPAAARP